MLLDKTEETDKILNSNVALAEPLDADDDETFESAEIEDEPPPRADAQWFRWPGAFRLVLTVEGGLYILLIGLAIFSRFFELDYRALHHDEGVHAFYSWQLYNGGGYQQEPWKHGPFLYHVTALIFWLFGDSDQTTRISTAIFGVLMCLLPLGLRKELGRWGTLTASFLLLISPMFVYYSRFLREDIFTAFATMALFIGLVRFVDRPSGVWWNVSMLSLALLFCTKEVSFFYLALFGGFLVGWLCWQLAPRLLFVLGGYALVALVIFFFVMRLYPPPVIPFETTSGETVGTYIIELLVHPILWTMLILGGLGLAIAWLSFQEVAGNRRQFMVRRSWAELDISKSQALFEPYQEQGTVAYAVAWLGRNWGSVFVGLGLAFGFYFVFFTGFFTDVPQGSIGLFSGLWYWMAQQGVARGNQPWFYYFFMLPLYEPLALMLGTLSGGYIVYKATRYGFARQYRVVNVVSEVNDNELDNDDEATPKTIERQVTIGVKPPGNALWPSRRRREVHPYFVPLWLVVWAFGSLALYTWASEKMPWLTVQLTLPFILLSAYLMNRVWLDIEQFFMAENSREEVVWGLSSRAFFWLQLGGMIVTGFFFYMTMLQLTSAELKISSNQASFEWLIAWVPAGVAILLFTAFFSFLGIRLAIKTTVAAVFVLMTIFVVHTASTYAFDHGDVALEMGVYTQTTPDAYRAIKELNIVTMVLAEHKATPVLYDDDLRTPYDFYLRNYTAKQRLTNFKLLADEGKASIENFPVVMIAENHFSSLSDSQKRSLANDYIARDLTFHYWFDEVQYRDFDDSIAIQTAALLNRPSAASIKDANNKTVLNKGDAMTNERLQQLSGMPGVLDKVYNANGGNAALLHIKESGKSLYKLRTPGDFSRLWRFLMYRDQTQPLGRREFTLYIKKDIAWLWRQYADLVDFPISRPQ